MLHVFSHWAYLLGSKSLKHETVVAAHPAGGICLYSRLFQRTPQLKPWEIDALKRNKLFYFGINVFALTFITLLV